MFAQSSGQMNTFDMTEVGYIERVVIGTSTPDNIPSEADNNKQMAFVNRCLSDFPKGKVIGIERSFSVVRIGEHQVVLESVVYHIGFKKIPMWLSQVNNQPPQYDIDMDKVNDIVEQNIDKT